MTIQLSYCCKAEIALDKNKQRPDCYTCKDCGRVIGSALPIPGTNDLLNAEEQRLHDLKIDIDVVLEEVNKRINESTKWNVERHSLEFTKTYLNWFKTLL